MEIIKFGGILPSDVIGELREGNAIQFKCAYHYYEFPQQKEKYENNVRQWIRKIERALFSVDDYIPLNYEIYAPDNEKEVLVYPPGYGAHNSTRRLKQEEPI